MMIHVANLGKHFREMDLRNLFSSYGKIDRAVIIRDRYSGLSKGAALVEMSVEAHALQAIKALDNRVYNGKKISVRPQPTAL